MFRLGEPFRTEGEGRRPMTWAQKLALIAGLMGATIVLGGAYWWEHTLSSDFRKAALDAVSELDSFSETGACSGLLLYGFAVERINLAVHKAEAEASTVADKKAARDLRLYYQVLTERDKNCDTDVGQAVGRLLVIDLAQAYVYADLDLKSK
jgi:hypothetical protein